MSLPSEIRLVDLVHEASQKMAELAGFDEDEALNVALAAREAVINAITHGNHSDPTRKVDMKLTVNRRALRITVRDHGAGFDPEFAKDPTSGDNRLRSHGRGLLLIRAFVDEVKFRNREGRGMEVTLVKNVRNGKTPAIGGDAGAREGRTR